MQTQTTSDGTSEWLELRRLADELELKIHLASMEARDRWFALQPRLDEVQKAIARSEQKLDDFIQPKIAKLTAAFRKIRDEIKAAKAPNKPW